MCVFFGPRHNMIFLEFCSPPKLPSRILYSTNRKMLENATKTTLPGLHSVPKAKTTWLYKKLTKKEKKRGE